MITRQTTVPTARSIRLIHAAMVIGVLLFAPVGHFVLRPTMVNSGELPEVVTGGLLGLSLGATALGLLLRKRLPKRSTDESADAFWTTATTPALVMWSTLEFGSLLGVFVYARTGALAALGVAAIAMLAFVVLNPANLERR